MSLKKRIASMLALAMTVALSSQVVFAQVSPSLATQVEPAIEILDDVDSGVDELTVPQTDRVESDLADEIAIDGDEDAQRIGEPESSTIEVSEPGNGDAAGGENEPEPAWTPFNTIAATGPGCSYADPGTGAYAQTLCWIDFEDFTTEYVWANGRYESVLGSQYTVPGSQAWADSRYWGAVVDFPIEVDLGGGNILTAKLSTSSTGNLGKGVESHVFPTWASAFLGNTLNGESFYTGVDGRPAIYNRENLSDSSQITVRLSDIVIASGGQPVENFAMVVADAETTDAGESIHWTTTGEGFRWLPNTPGATDKTGVMGNACPESYSPAINGALSQNAHCSANSSSSKNGTPMLATAPPLGDESFEISQILSGNGRQGVAFGILLARTSIEVNVVDRVLDASGTPEQETVFNGSVSSGNTVLVNASTGPDGLTSDRIGGVLPTSDQENQLVFTSEAVGDLGSSYTAAWQCEKDDPDTGETLYWPSATTTSPIAPGAGEQFTQINPTEYIACTVTYTPPYLTLEKEVDAAGTDAVDSPDSFVLAADGNAGVVSHISGVTGSSAVTERPVAVGSYALSESTSGSTTWGYGYDWTDLMCTHADGQSLPSVTTTRDGVALSGAELNVGAGDDITCVFTNTAKEPRLATKKEAFNANGEPINWGIAVTPGQEISYKLTFDNSQGTAAMELAYIDYLGDVLDDAGFSAGSIRISDGSESSYPDSDMSGSGVTVTELVGENDEPQLQINGQVLGGQARAVWFKVTVLANTVNAVEREAGIERADNDRPNRVGYALNNYLVQADEPVPGVCDEPVDGADSDCVYHPVPAWSLTKNARPADGALLHEGGNAHYQITALKLNEATEIDRLVFTDDLTHVFLSAGWAPDAAVPGGALKRGIYFFDENGQTLDQDGIGIGTPEWPEPAFDAGSGIVPEPQLVDGRWILESMPVDVPTQAVKAEMWFAVQAAEIPAGIPESLHSGSMMGRSFTNYVSASSTTLAPNQCETVVGWNPNIDTDPLNGAPADESYPDDCRVTHGISANYFTIRKDAAGAGVDTSPSSIWGDSTGLTNLVGHEFQIQDDVDGQPSGAPSKYLCRTGYDPLVWNGVYDSSGEPDWGEKSQTLAAIIEHNNNLTEGEEPLPRCALLYAQGTYGDPSYDHAGGQNGRWRSQNLPEGNFWLFETRAPNKQIDNVDGEQERDVPGVQLLSEPILFTIWPEDDGELIPGSTQSRHGASQLDVVSGQDNYLDRCSPGAPVGDRPVACINPTGYLMIVKDAVPLPLPLTGGMGATAVTAGGAVILLSAMAGIWWWRRRADDDPTVFDNE